MTRRVERGFALRGQLADEEIFLPLREGGNPVGSDPSCHLCLPQAGVSKRHARLVVEDGRVQVEDLASKNGTFVNDQQIDARAIEPGDRVTFGAVSLFLETIAPEEARLAIDLGQPTTAQSTNAETSTYFASSSASARRDLEILDAFVRRLQPDDSASLAPALADLCRELALAGLCLFQISSSREPLLLASAGRLDALDLSALGQALLDQGTLQGRVAPQPSDPSEQAPSSVFLRVTETRELGLAAWSESAPQLQAQILLGIVLTLVERSYSRRPSARRSGASRARVRQGRSLLAELVWPEGYVPGTSPTMENLYRQLQPMVRSDLPVLVLGETGTGKESIVQILHASSERRAGPLVPVNCAAIPTDLLEAELFGIGGGVATGVTGRRGKFQEADGGTLFLDEIGDMPLELQAKLLRALQQGQIRPLGKEPVAVDVRIVSATNSDLETRMQGGQFRRDLFYRLAGLVLRLPTLDQRQEDIPTLVDFFLRRECATAGKSIRGLTVGAMQQLTRRPWPGNVRELEHQVRRLVYLCPDHRVIDSNMVSATAHAIGGDASGESEASTEMPGLDLQSVERIDLAQIENAAIREALRRSDGQVTRAATHLGITRQALRRRMARYGIS
ncbi:MAG: sigma 54-interacting transcriptional regulator [Acidobacteriota bacterium]